MTEPDSTPDDTREFETEIPVDENEVAPPTDAPDALADADIDEIEAAEVPPEEDPYQLRSGVPLGGGEDSDPGSQLNF